LALVETATLLRAGALIGIIASFAMPGATGELHAVASSVSVGDRGGQRPALAQYRARQIAEGAVAAAGPATPDRRPSFGYRFKQWSLRVGVFLLGMVILGFLAVSALFLPPAGGWFIYVFLLPFLVWVPAMTLHPAAGWALGGFWLVCFPALRRWLHTTPSGERWCERWRSFVALFDGGDPGTASWRGFSSAGSRRASSPTDRGGKSSTFSGRGGRFGGGGSSSRW
jgi:uncharacterized membrane protein YgcG